jgi:hypothetical protein
MASFQSNARIAAKQQHNEKLRQRFLDAKERAIGVGTAEVEAGTRSTSYIVLIMSTERLPCFTASS